LQTGFVGVDERELANTMLSQRVCSALAEAYHTESVFFLAANHIAKDCNT
jgi:hypothetical protein